MSKDNEENKKNTIEVDKNKFKTLLDEMEILKNTVSKQRYSEAEEAHDKKFVLQGHLKRLRGELIVGWYPMLKTGKGIKYTIYDNDNNKFDIKEEDTQAIMEIIYRDNVPVGEKLVGHYKTIDGKDIVCDAVEFYRSTVVEKFDKIADEGQFWIVKFHNKSLPNNYKLNINFINP